MANPSNEVLKLDSFGNVLLKAKPYDLLTIFSICLSDDKTQLLLVGFDPDIKGIMLVLSTNTMTTIIFRKYSGYGKLYGCLSSGGAWYIVGYE